MHLSEHIPVTKWSMAGLISIPIAYVMFIPTRTEVSLASWGPPRATKENSEDSMTYLLNQSVSPGRLGEIYIFYHILYKTSTVPWVTVLC